MPGYDAKVFCLFDIPSIMLKTVEAIVIQHTGEKPVVIVLCEAESIRNEVKALIKGKNVRVVFTDPAPTW